MSEGCREAREWTERYGGGLCRLQRRGRWTERKTEGAKVCGSPDLKNLPLLDPNGDREDSPYTQESFEGYIHQ